MSLVRCGKCREIVNTDLSRYCPGCGSILPEARTGQGLQTSAAQHEALRDAGRSKYVFVLLAIMGALAAVGIDWVLGVSIVLSGLVSLWAFSRVRSKRLISSFQSDSKRPSGAEALRPAAPASDAVYAALGAGALGIGAVGMGVLGIGVAIAIGALITIAVAVGGAILIFITCLNIP